MKHTIILLVALFLGSLNVNAANKKLFNYIDSDTLSSKQKERIKKLSNKSHHQKIIKLEESAFRNSTSSFDIELLDIGLLTFSDIKSRKNNLGHTIINSKSLDSSTDRLTLTSTPDGTFVGILFAGGKIYDILPISDDIYSLTENNEVNLPEEPILEDLSDEASTSYDDSVFESTYDSNNYITSSSSLAASNVIDIAVVYTDNALDELGSESAIEAQIMLMHDQINTIMENNGVDSAVAAQLVYVGPTSYEQSANDIFTYLDDLKDGTVPETDDLRNAYGADIVAMIVSDGGYCGVATLTASANQAFMVVKTFCTNYTFAHELGHLIGMNHNYEESPSNNYYHGYLLEGVHRTVLSYNSENTSTPRIPYWSSDDQSVDGYSIGNATLADNERRLLARDTTVSNFRTTAEFDNDPTASISSNVCYGQNTMSFTTYSSSNYYRVYRSSSSNMTSPYLYGTWTGGSAAITISSSDTDVNFAVKACVTDTDDACTELSNSVTATYIPRCSTGGTRG